MFQTGAYPKPCSLPAQGARNGQPFREGQTMSKEEQTQKEKFQDFMEMTSVSKGRGMKKNDDLFDLRTS
jgi:hypothetical protein